MTSPRLPDDVATLPLSMAQKVTLFFRTLRVVFALLPFALYLVFLTGRFGPPPLVFYLLMLGVLLFVGYDSLRALRDLLHGGVEVRDDVLVRSRASRRGRHYFGEFQTLGRVSMSKRAHFGGQNGSTHRVTYSPISKYVWSAEPKAPYG